MVAHFKVIPGNTPVYRITRDNVEEQLGRRAPWFRPGQQRDDDRHFALCPYCSNAIQLKGIYRQDAQRQYGSHLGTPTPGFAFNLTDLEFCPYKLSTQSRDKGKRRQPGPVSNEIIDLALTQFDRIVLILREDFGFTFSNKFAGRMLEQWIDSQGYLYTGAHLRNVPWMIAYFAPAQSLFGQFVGRNEELAEGIRAQVLGARIDEQGRLTKGPQWFKVDLQCLHHRMAIDPGEGTLSETLKLRVQDFTATNEAAKAPRVYQRIIEIDPERFEALIHTPEHRAMRNDELLALAQEIAQKRGLR